MDFYLAGTLTTISATQTMVYHFASEQKSLAKARQEFNSCVKKDNPDADHTKGELKDYLREHVTYERCQDLAYLSNVGNEALRYEPPISVTTQACLS
jgi:cytochrome P450